MKKVTYTFILCESWNWAVENLENDVLGTGKHDTYGNNNVQMLLVKLSTATRPVGKVTDYDNREDTWYITDKSIR